MARERTVWKDLEPAGFGDRPFGDPSTEEEGKKIHRRGFGDKKTEWTDYEEE